MNHSITGAVIALYTIAFCPVVLWARVSTSSRWTGMRRCPTCIESARLLCCREKVQVSYLTATSRCLAACHRHHMSRRYSRGTCLCLVDEEVPIGKLSASGGQVCVQWLSLMKSTSSSAFQCLLDGVASSCLSDYGNRCAYDYTECVRVYRTNPCVWRSVITG